MHELSQSSRREGVKLHLDEPWLSGRTTGSSLCFLLCNMWAYGGEGWGGVGRGGILDLGWVDLAIELSIKIWAISLAM